jgi:hypothetical protein
MMKNQTAKFKKVNLDKILKYQSETLIDDTPFFGQKKKSPILYLKIVIS